MGVLFVQLVERRSIEEALVEQEDHSPAGTDHLPRRTPGCAHEKATRLCCP